jgi:restriction endonuclease S subunit
LKTTLGHIANLQTGIFAQTDPDGEIVYLQARHFNEYGQLHSILHPDVKKEYVNEKHLLRPGDIVFAAKGTKNFAAWYESNNMPAVASTSFFVIRLKDDLRETILPGYLVWFINQPVSQKFLKGNAIGTSMVSISKAVLEKLEVSIPALAIQEAILKITQLRTRERQLKERIEILKEQQIQQQLINVLK